MPANVKVIRASEFIRAQADGQANLEKAEQILNDIAHAGAGLNDFDILIDIRKIEGTLSAKELWGLAEKLVSHRGTFDRRTAILCPLINFDHAKFFALCAENRGFNIHVFTAYEDAMEWLLSQ